MLFPLHKGAEAVWESACPGEQLLQQDPLLKQGIPGGELLHHCTCLHPVAVLLLAHQSSWFHWTLFLVTFFFTVLIIRLIIFILIIILILTVLFHVVTIFTESCVRIETEFSWLFLHQA